MTFDRVPLVATIRSYRKSFLRPDLLTGVVLATMLIPQGMAYAELTGLPSVTGIYTTIAALVGYSLFGPNRHLVLGPDSSLAPVIAAVILPLAAGNPADAIAFASMMSLLTGVVCILAGLFRLGVVTELLSRPMRVGYLNGIAVLIFVSQLPKALGIATEATAPWAVVGESARALVEGSVDWATLALSVGCIVVILFLNRVSRLKPGVLVAALGSIAVVAIFGLAVSLVGEVPSGLPPLAFPGTGLTALPTLALGALAVALVSFADTGALSTATAHKTGERVDPNSEIMALGSANLFSGMFQGFATSASSSRTAVALAVGSRTQVAGLVAAVGVVAIIALAPGFVSEMPEATLAAIVMSASFALFDWKGWSWLLRVRRSEFLLSFVTALAVVAIGVLEGIGLALVLSLLNFVRKAWRPHSTELGKIAGVPGYHDRERHPEAEVVEGLLIIRYDAPLFFANAPDFGRTLMEKLDHADRPITGVLVVGNAITDIDSTGAEILAQVLDDLGGRGVRFSFGGLKGPVKDRLRAYGLYDRIGDANFLPNTIAGVEAHRGDDAGGD